METTYIIRNVWLTLFLIFIFFQHAGASDQASDEQLYSHLLDSAEILKLKSHYDEAIDLIKEVRTRSLESEQWAIYVRSLVELADVFRFTYYYSQDSIIMNQAFGLMETAFETINEKLNANHEVLSRYYIYKGKLIRDQGYSIGMSYSDTVEIFLNKAKKVLDKNPKAYPELAKLNYEYGYYYSKTGEIKKAEIYYIQLQEIVEKQLDRIGYFRAYYLFQGSNFYFAIGDYEKSLLCANIALYIFEHAKHNDISNALTCRNLIANSYFSTNRYSHETFQKSFLHYKKVYDALSSSSNDSSFTSLTLYNMGVSLFELQKYDSCKQILDKALAINPLRTSTHRIIKADALLHLGLINLIDHNDELANKYFRESLNSFQALPGKHYETHVAFRLIGEAYEKAGNYTLALEYYQKGLIAIYKDFDSENIYDNPTWEKIENLEPVFYILFDKARTLYGKYKYSGNTNDLLASFNIYLKGYELLNRLLKTKMMNESFIMLFQNFQKDFQLSVACAVDAYEILSEKSYLSSAFTFIEQSRYFLLLKSQQNRLLKNQLRDDENLFFAERSLNREIEYLKHQINNSGTAGPDQIFALRNLLLEKIVLKTELWNRINSIIDTSPVNVENDILSLKLVQDSILKENETIVEYHWSEHTIFALLITRNNADVIKIPVNPELIQHISTYSESLTKNSTSKEAYTKFTRSSYALYRSLFEPVMEWNSQQPELTEANFTIIADDELAVLPFEAFTTYPSDTTTVNYWGLPYLQNNCTINYGYSLNILYTNLGAENTHNSKILAMSYSAIGENEADIKKLRDENELPYSGQEIKEISNIFRHADFNAYNEATEDLFKSIAPDYAVIHLAIHGQADNIDKYNSKLLFNSSADSKEDGQLYAYELYNIDLTKNQLAVLSACETGLGKQEEGEGIFSIARGFAYSGCPAIVMSLWKVNDKSTSILMKYFYENLALGLAKDKALRNAKISYIENSDELTAHPANWAAFISMGNNRPVEIVNSNAWIFYAAAIVLLAIGIIFLYYRKS